MILGVDLPHPYRQFPDMPLPIQGDMRREHANTIKRTLKLLRDRQVYIMKNYNCLMNSHGFEALSPNSKLTWADPRKDQLLIPYEVRLHGQLLLSNNELQNDSWRLAHWTVTPRMLLNLHKNMRRYGHLPPQFKQFENARLQFGNLGGEYKAIAIWTARDGWTNGHTWRSIRWSPTNVYKPHGPRKRSLNMGYCDWRYPWHFSVSAVLPYLGSNYYQALAVGKMAFFWIPWMQFALENPTSSKLRWWDCEWWRSDVNVLVRTL